MAYPVVLNLSGRLAVVVGGGAVAARRAEALVGQGAAIRVVAPTVTDQIAQMARDGSCEIVAREFADSDVEGAFLVHAATDSTDANAAVAAAAEARGVLVCRADTSMGGSFSTPSAVKRGRLLLTVSTNGESPTLTAVLRDRLEQQFGAEYDLWVQLFGRLRDAIQAIASQDRRKACVSGILEAPAIGALVAEGKLDEAEKAARQCI